MLVFIFKKLVYLKIKKKVFVFYNNEYNNFFFLNNFFFYFVFSFFSNIFSGVFSFFKCKLKIVGVGFKFFFSLKRNFVFFKGSFSKLKRLFFLKKELLFNVYKKNQILEFFSFNINYIKIFNSNLKKNCGYNVFTGKGVFDFFKIIIKKKIKQLK